MKMLITGGCGFVGANLARHFLELGYEVTVLDNLVRRGSEFNVPDLLSLGARFVHGDVRNAEDLNALPKFDVICETSAQPSAIDGYANPVFDLNNNTFGLVNVLEKARRDEAILIFWSTNKVYSGDRVNAIPVAEEPTRWVWDKAAGYAARGFSYEHGISQDFDVDGGQHSIYGVSKICGDLICQEWFDAFGVRTVVNRFSCLAGPGQFGKSAQGWVAWWVIAHHFGLPLVYIGWNGKQVRDSLFTPDINRLVELEIEKIDACAGQVFNVGGGSEITLSLREMTAWCETTMGKSVPVEILPNPRKADHVVYISDTRRALEVLGWKPTTDLETGLGQIVEWVEAQHDRLASLYAPR
ncbi:MAG: NAD-dependent epimerase/dehydratase family protein [Candidatus Lernaella stagnicola]|nr:NAD-dependent epimerase/dehydratase family protein [Candidatus Lernaella stagnicola]